MWINVRFAKKEKPQKKFKDVIPVAANRIGEIWEIDTVGPFRESEQGYKFVVTMVDRFFKIAEVVPIYTKDTNTIVYLVDKHIIRKYGAPKAILSDNGKEFKNKICEDYTKAKCFICKYRSSYKPTTTELIERLNKIERLQNSENLIGQNVCLR